VRQSEKLVARHRAFAEVSTEGAGDRLRVLLLDATHHHAEVHRFDDDDDAAGLKHFLDRVADLVGEPFLDRKSVVYERV